MNEQRVKKDIWFAYFAVLLVWLFLTYGEIGHLLLEQKIFAFYDCGRPYISDFVDFFNAGILGRSCTAGSINIYDAVVQNEFMKRVIYPVVPELPLYFQYPPYMFVLLIPLTYLNLTAAWLMWDFIGAVVILYCCYQLSKNCFSSWFSRTFLIVATVAAFPAWLCFKLGQTSFWLLIGLFLFWTFAKKQEYAKAGLSTMFILLKFQYFPIIWLTGVVLASINKGVNGVVRFVIGSIAVSGFLISISVWKLGWNNVANYPAALLSNEFTQKVSGIESMIMQNLRGEIILFLGVNNSLTGIISAALLLLALFLVAILWIKVYPKLKLASQYSFEMCASLTTLTLLIASPHTQFHDYLIVVLPCVWLWNFLKEQGDSLCNWQKYSMYGLIILFPALSWVFYLFSFWFNRIYIQPFFLWALLLIGFTLASCRSITLPKLNHNVS